MNTIFNYFKGEPIAFIVGGIYGIFQALLMVLLSYNVPMSAQQVIALNTLLLAILVFAARGQVSPKDIIASAKAITDTAAQPPANPGG